MKLDKIKIFAPDNRINDYLVYCEMLFSSKEIEIIKKIEEIKKDNIILIDDAYLQHLKDFDDKNVTFLVLSANGYIDYKFSKKYINKLLNVKFFIPSNFDQDCIHLNNLSLNKLNKIKFHSLKNLNLIKKVKFCFPKLYGIYNFLKYFNIGKKILFKKKIIFCGKFLTDKKYIDVLEKKYNFSELSLEILRNNKLKDNENLTEKLKIFKKKLITEEFVSLPIHEKFIICQNVFRFFLFSHLNNFSNFMIFQKKNLDLLRTNIYKNLFQININPQVGNSKIYSRSLLIERFYNDKKIDLFFFLNESNYNNSSQFTKRAITVCNFLNKILEIKHFNCDTDALENYLKKNSEEFLKYD